MKVIMIKAVIFDYDGVIVDTLPAVFEVYKVICRRFGVREPRDIEEYRSLYGYNFKSCLKN